MFSGLPNTVTIAIDVVGNALSSIGQIRDGINSIRSSAGSVNNIVGGVAPGVDRASGAVGAFGSLLGNLGASAITSGIGIISQQFDNVKSSIMEASTAQTEFITASAALSTSIGLPIEQTKKSMESLQNQLSIAAADLPGENKDYIAVLNQISDTMGKVYKGNMQAFEANTLDVTKRTAALAATIPGLSGGAAGMSIERLITGGGTWGELKKLDLFQKIPQLRDAIETGMKDSGLTGKKWQGATDEQRLAVVQKALKTAATDELFKEFENTAESMIEGMKSKLFDLRTGVFGFLRRVDTRQDRSVLDSFTEVLRRLRNLGAAGARLARSLGLAFDPMETLIDFFDGVNNFMGNITYQLDISKPQDAFNNIAAYLGQYISGLIDWVLKGVRGFNTDTLSQLVTQYMSILGNFISNINWVDLGKTIGITIIKLIVSVVKALRAANNPAFTKKLLDAVGDTLYGIITGALEAVGKELYKAFVQPIVNFFDKIKQWFNRLRSMLPNVSNPFQGVANAAAAVVPGGGLIKAGVELGSKILGVDLGAKLFGMPGQPNNPTADKVNGDNKPMTPVPPKTTASAVSNNTNNSNTIQNLNIAAATPQDAHGIASTVIEELERRLGFRQAQQLA